MWDKEGRAEPKTKEDGQCKLLVAATQVRRHKSHWLRLENKTVGIVDITTIKMYITIKLTLIISLRVNVGRKGGEASA